MGFDHNWCGQNGGCPAPYAQTLASDANALPFLHGIAWHCYSGTASDMTTFHTSNPNVGIFHTECATGPWLTSTGAATDYYMAALNLVFDTTRNWAQSTVLWPVALDKSAGPQNSGCSNCRPFAIVDAATDSYTFNPEYYAFGHLSKFLRPGAYRIDASDGVAGVHTVAFQNADKSGPLGLQHEQYHRAVQRHARHGAVRLQPAAENYGNATMERVMPKAS